MKTQFQTFDGRIFSNEDDAAVHEDTITNDAFEASGISDYLDTLDAERDNYWCSTERAHAVDAIWPLFQWCIKNGKTLRIEDIK